VVPEPIGETEKYYRVRVYSSTFKHVLVKADSQEDAIQQVVHGDGTVEVEGEGEAEYDAEIAGPPHGG
jgi:hypothetical protein